MTSTITPGGMIPATFKKHPLKAMIAAACIGSGVTLTLAPALVLGAAIEEILVVDQQQDYKIDRSALGKFTESLLDTPQAITVVSEQLMADRAMMSLDDALRNVPGITLGAGEFSWQGNNPSIRGFSSRNDMFLDGMRDFGNYSRDPFNLQSVEVLQGPSSMVFGRGSTGGVINQASKIPVAEPLRKLHINAGNASTRRITADINQPLPDLGREAAVRLNVMKHNADTPGRDGGNTDRYGIAPSLALSLGNATSLSLSFMNQHGQSTPDYGLPWLEGKPADVDSATFYGFDTDYVNTDAQITTARIDHEFTKDLKANAQVRYADYSRQSRITEPQVDASVTLATPQDQVNVARKVFQGESNERMLQAQFNLQGNFTSGNIEHVVVSGLEVAHETSSPTFGFGEGVPSTTLLNPINEPFSATSTAPRLNSSTDGDSLAAYFLDTVKFNQQWELVLGVRWDKFATNYVAYRYAVDGSQTSSEQIIRTDIETSYRSALVYKPVEEGTFYLGWGTSFNPSSEGLSFISSGRGLTISNAYLEPETNESVELGTKWQLFENKLFVESSLFHITKSNARVPDPANSGFNILAGEQVVDGFSLNMSGRINSQLKLTGGYTYLDSEQKKTTQLTVPTDSPLQNVAKNTFSVWANYDVTGSLQLAAGARFVDDRLATTSQPTKSVPDYWAFDAMAKYQASENTTLKLNVTNITDEYYFDQLHPWHVIPGPGLLAIFAVNLDY